MSKKDIWELTNSALHEFLKQMEKINGSEVIINSLEQ